MILGILLYGAIVPVTVMRSVRHYELIAIVLQVALLLPALWIGLKGSQPDPAGWPVRGRWVAATAAAFLLVAGPVSWIVTRGITNPDESAYRFQARILASGRLVAMAPPGAPERPNNSPAPLKYNQHILSVRGWYSKYPIGWPLLLAIPERFGWAWIVNPLLAAGILICTARIARVAFQPASAVLAAVLLALSPYFLAQCVTRMSHAFAGLLVAATTLLCVEGLRSRKLRHFIGMYLLIVLGFHVRPFTSLIVAVTLSISVIVFLRRDRTLLTRVLFVGFAAALAAGTSIALYNLAFTGSALISPYAQYRGATVPAEVSTSPAQVAVNLKSVWRFSSQSTILFSFPLLFVCAALGFWASRKRSPLVWVLMALFAATVVGHLIQFESSGSVIPERYWFESFFAVAILAAEGLLTAVAALKSSRRSLVLAACGLVIIQVPLMLVACRILMTRSFPSAAVRQVAEKLGGCNCVVFLKKSPPLFYGEHLNLNGPDWQSANAFFAVDPGPEQRSEWTRVFGRSQWILVTYDPGLGAGSLVGAGK
jgi:hypothetical protein